MKTFRRDHDRRGIPDAEWVLGQRSAWFDDYKTTAPHSAVGMRSPTEYRTITRIALVSVSEPAIAETPARHLPQDVRSTEGPLSEYAPKLTVATISPSSQR